MKKLKNKSSLTNKPEAGIIAQQEPYEIVFADPRDAEINLKFLKKSQISAHMARWFLDQEYNQLIWSDGIFEILELDPRKYGANYDSFMGMVHPEDRELKQQAQENLKKTFIPIELNYRLLFDDERIKWINEICNTDFDQEGHPIRSYGTIQDITKYKVIEENFRKKEAQFKDLIESIPSGIAIIQNNKFAFFNPAAQKIFAGNISFQFIGKTVAKIIHPQSSKLFIKKIKSVLSKHHEVVFEEKLMRLDGSLFDAEITLSPRLFHSIPAVLLIVNDVTKRKNNEEDLRKSEEKFRILVTDLSENENRLKDLVATKDKFFSIIAHDLRGPLGGFLGLTKIIANEPQILTDDQNKEMASALYSSAQNTYDLLQNLLEWSQMVRGNTTFIPQNLVLKDIITECLSLATESAREKSISLIMEISDELQVFADSNMLQTIIRNLLSNSIKFTRHRGRVTIAAEPAENNMIVISVKDTGIGMNNEMVQNIFRIDVNTKRTGTNNEASTGLGLLLCKEFVEKHGGEIVVKSVENKGSEFFFTIPCTMIAQMNCQSW